MNKKLEHRIARLEKLLSRKNEASDVDIAFRLIDSVANHLSDTLNAMKIY